MMKADMCKATQVDASQSREKQNFWKFGSQFISYDQEPNIFLSSLPNKYLIF